MPRYRRAPHPPPLPLPTSPPRGRGVSRPPRAPHPPPAPVAGAGWIDEAAARDDHIVVDRVAARTAARAVASGDGRSVAVTATADRGCVRGQIRGRPPRPA